MKLKINAQQNNSTSRHCLSVVKKYVGIQNPNTGRPNVSVPCRFLGGSAMGDQDLEQDLDDPRKDENWKI